MKTFGVATVLALLLAAPAVAAPAVAATDENISIETLLKDGWQIPGYAAANPINRKSESHRRTFLKSWRGLYRLASA
jgi:hypothetical protein